MFRLLILSLFCATSALADNPNVILIYVDDMGYGDASCLNPKSKFQTPNIDRLAKEGMSFTDGHSSDTVCTPSRYGLLTGRYSWRTTMKRGVMGAEGACLIADDRMTLASFLRDNGYATAMVGKWHLGMDFPGVKGNRDWSKPTVDMPLDKGFDYFWGIPASMNYGVLAWFEGRRAKVPPILFTRKKPNQIADEDYRIKPPYQANPVKPNDLEVAQDFIDIDCLNRFTEQAIKWLDGQAAAARNGKPFMLYLSHTSPHKPVIPLKRFRGKGSAGAYGEFMMETDWQVGRVLDWLDKNKLTDNTIVVFTSDNGPENTWRRRIEEFNHHSNGVYREGKRSIYEGGHRVPFFVRWPNKVKAGSKWSFPVCQTDFLATFADMLGKKLPDNSGEDSVSFYRALIGQVAPQRLAMIHHGMRGRYAVREGKWKLIMESGRKNSKMELYNLSTDPGEDSNLIMKHPDVAKRLGKRITEIVQNGRTTPGRPQKNDTAFWSDLYWMKDRD
jgi:arylsulfatase A